MVEPVDYSEAIASALRSELGDTHRAVKTVMKWTGASERAVKNWLSGERGPHGRYLVKILRHSDGALQTILAASRRLDLLTHFLQQNGAAKLGLEQRRLNRAPSLNVLISPSPNADPNRDPNNDLDDDLDGEDEQGLNSRQRWFLSVIGKRRRANARDIQKAFAVSEKTAKRDIATLKAKGLLQFVGTRRKGRYVFLTSETLKP